MVRGGNNGSNSVQQASLFARRLLVWGSWSYAIYGSRAPAGGAWSIPGESWGALGLRQGRPGSLHSWDGGPWSEAQDRGGAGEGRQLQQQGGQVTELTQPTPVLQHQRPEDPRRALPPTRTQPRPVQKVTFIQY